MGELMSPQSHRSDLAALAAGQIDSDDVAVLQSVAVLYNSLDPVPAGLVDRIQFGITLDALHAEIAELERSGEVVGARSEATEAQTVTFNSSSLTTMITISLIAADRVRLDGWAAPGAGFSVELRIADDTMRTTADIDGRFVFQDVSRGFAQLVLRPPAGSSQPPIVTPAIEI
jgi:hypothetical protein